MHGMRTKKERIRNTMDEKHDRRIDNCIACPEHELWALRDLGDWFSHDTRISCRAADGRTIVDCMSSDRLGERISVPGWCPRRNDRAQSKL